MARRTSPDGDGDRQCERDDDRAEVEPDPISLFVLGKHEKLDHHPQTPRDSQSKPDQIAGSSCADRPFMRTVISNLVMPITARLPK